MPGESISQIAQTATVLNGLKDLLVISQWTGNPSAPYVTKKMNPNLLAQIIAALQSTLLFGTLTLNANSTSTTVSIPGCTAASIPILTPKTVDARANMPATVADLNQLDLTHGSNPNNDQTFYYLILVR